MKHTQIVKLSVWMITFFCINKMFKNKLFGYNNFNILFIDFLYKKSIINLLVLHSQIFFWYTLTSTVNTLNVINIHFLLIKIKYVTDLVAIYIVSTWNWIFFLIYLILFLSSKSKTWRNAHRSSYVPPSWLSHRITNTNKSSK